MDIEILKQLGIAILLSGLVGLEREKKAQISGSESFAGIRTFLLIGVLGFLTFVVSEFSQAIAGIFAAGFLGILVVSYYFLAKNKGWIGITSEMAAIIVYAIGVLCAMNMFVFATALTLFLVFVLSFKNDFHKWVNNIKQLEIISMLQFALIAFVVLPILPNVGYGPFGFFNPYIIWLMVVFISGISFVSYIAIKILGAKKGIIVTGFLSGLVSSTALVLSYSGQSKRTKNIVNPYVVAVVIASSAMFFRVLLEVAVLNVELVKDLAIPMGSMGVVGVGFALYYFFGKPDASELKGKAKDVELKNPFSLWPALKFGMFFASILFFSSVAQEYFGNMGIYVTSVVSGVLDVDAITVSLANLSKDGVSNSVAVTGITLAAITNTISKAVIFFMLGSREVAKKIFMIFGIILLVGLISLMLV